MRLASRLVGWEIDVRTKEMLTESLKELSKLKSVTKRTAQVLVNAGYCKVKDLAKADVKDLKKIKGIGEKKAERIIEEAKRISDENL